MRGMAVVSVRIAPTCSVYVYEIDKKINYHQTFQPNVEVWAEDREKERERESDSLTDNPLDVVMLV